MASSDDNWQKDKCLADCNLHMLEDQLECDIYFKFPAHMKPGCSLIGAHRYMLLSRSTVFFTMLSQRWTNDDKPIVIEDIGYDDFWTMLRFIYTDDASVTMENVFGVLHAGKKYMLSSLVKHCLANVDRCVTHANVWYVKEKAQLYDETNLVERCNALIESNIQATLSGSFEGVSRATLEEVLRYEKTSQSPRNQAYTAGWGSFGQQSRDQVYGGVFGQQSPSPRNQANTVLSFRDNRDISRLHPSAAGCRELLFFNAAVAWAKSRCSAEGLDHSGENLRRALDTALFLIRFPLMSITEFADIVIKCGILNQEEEIAVFRYLSCQVKPEVHHFPTRPRFATV